MSTINGSMGSSAAEQPDTLYCANHPNVPTYLRCGNCDKPICAKCRVSTPVGFRCLDCAQIKVLPTYAVQNTQYIRAAAAGFGLATIVGALWGLLPGFEFWATLILGIGAGEVVSAAVNMKRGPGLQAVGLAAVAWGIIVSRIVLVWLLRNNVELLASIPGNPTAVFSWVPLADFGHIWQLTLNGGGGLDFTSLIFLLMAFGLTFIRLR